MRKDDLEPKLRKTPEEEIPSGPAPNAYTNSSPLFFDASKKQEGEIAAPPPSLAQTPRNDG